MKKRMVIGASLVALILSIGLFTISIFAAVGQSFGVNNKIKFDGIDDAISFDMSAIITGTIDEGDERLEKIWRYNPENGHNPTMEWNIAGDLIFDEKNKSLEPTANNRIAINYSFTVTNNSETEKRIRLSINNLSADINALETRVLNSYGQEVTEVIIAKDQTDTIILKVMPLLKFSGAKICNFSLQFMPVD